MKFKKKKNGFGEKTESFVDYFSKIIIESP